MSAIGCTNMLSLLLLLAQASADCISALKADFNATVDLARGQGDDLDALKALIFDGKSANDLGHYQSCLDLKDRSYVIFQTQGEPHPIVYGLCVPEECKAEDIQSLVDDKQPFQGASYKPEVRYPAEYSLGLAGGMMVLLLCLLFCFVVAGSYADFMFTQAANAKSPQGTEIPLESLSKSSHYSPLVDPEVTELSALPPQLRLLRSFSVFANVKKLADAGNNEPELLALDGVKVMSLFWMMLANVYVMRFYGATINPEDEGEIAAHWTTVFAYSGVFATDTFLWVSAFVLSNTLFVGVTKGRNETKRLIKGRVLRWLPLVIFCLWFFNAVVPALGYGPLWHRIELLTEDCGSYWWTNLLFLNNFVPSWTGNHCLGVGWYVALDLQLLLLLPVFLIIYMKYPNTVCWAVWSGCIALGVVLTSSIATIEGFKVAFIARENYSHDFVLKIMAKPYCRICAYLLGAYCAATFFAVKVEETEDHLMRRIMYSLKKSSYGAVISVLLGLGTITFVTLVQRPVYEDWRNGYAGWTDSGNESFLGFEHLIFSLGLSMVLLPVLLGEAKWVGKVLTLPFWRPLARLGICVFFTHVAVARILFAGEQRGYYWQKFGVFKDFVLVSSISYAFGFFLYILFDAPVRNLLRVYLRS